MKKSQLALMTAILFMIIAGSACNRNVYDQEEDQRWRDSISPVDSVDAQHTWILTATKTLMVTTPDTGSIKMVKILTANPRVTGDAEVVGEAYASAGETVTMSVTYSNRQTMLYAAAVDSSDYYTITSFEPNAISVVNFD